MPRWFESTYSHQQITLKSIDYDESARHRCGLFLCPATGHRSELRVANFGVFEGWDIAVKNRLCPVRAHSVPKIFRPCPRLRLE